MITFAVLLLSPFLLLDADIIDYRNPRDGQPLSSSITAISRDSLGFLWVASSDELARFDGHGYDVIDGEIAADLFDGDNTIHSMCFIASDRLLLCTDKGIFILDTRHLKLSMSEPLSGLRAYNVLRSDNGILMLSTNHGVFSYRPEADEAAPVFDFVRNGGQQAYPQISSVSCKRSGELWLSYSGLLARFRYGDNISQLDTVARISPRMRIYVDKFDNFYLYDRHRLLISDPEGFAHARFKTENIEVSSISESGDNLLIGVRGQGNIIIRRDSAGREISRETLLPSSHFDDFSSTTNTFYDDGRGNLWLGTRGGLFLYLDKTDSPFINLKNDVSSQNTPSHNTISDIWIQDRNTIWIATAFGLNRLKFNGPAAGEYQMDRYFAPSSDEDQVSANKIEQIESDPEGYLWLGTKTGIRFFKPESKEFFRNPKIDAAIGKSNFVRALFRDSSDNIWVGFENGGLFKREAGRDTLEKVTVKTPDGELDNCTAINGDRNGYLWVGTKKNGLYRLSTMQDDLDQTSYILKDAEGRTASWISCIYVDPYNNIWCGTSEGLFRYDYEDNAFVYIPLPIRGTSKYISGIINDDRGKLWIAATSGICRYDVIDNVGQFIQLNGGSFCRPGFVFGCDKNSDGYIFAGGINGLTFFHPDTVSADTTRYHVYITDFKVRNRILEVGSEELPQDINFMDRITLAHKDNQISISFSELAFTDTEGLQYAYMLEGINKEWIYAGSETHSVSYGNLPKGTYRLRIKSSNRAGVWMEEPHVLEIRIRPSEFLSWYAWIIYALLLFLLILGIVKIYGVREKLRTQKLISKMRLKFYSDISYSIKNPLSLLKAPLDKLINDYENISADEGKLMLETIRKSSNRLSLLVDELVDFCEIDQGSPSLQLKEVDFIHYAGNIADSFSHLFENKQIDFSFHHEADSAPVIIDIDKMDIVFFSLISNAFKFTPSKGKVSLSCGVLDDGSVWAKVSDNGAGISKSDQKHIFERFWAGSNSESGSGIGLSLAKEIIELHHGSISVNSELGKGSTFRFSLPKNAGLPAFKANMLDLENPAPSPVLEEYIQTLDYQTVENQNISNGPLVYVVTKDRQLRHYLESMLSPEMKVVSFASPEGVYDQVVKNKPKLVISGVVFSKGKEGLEFCRKMKSNPSTSIIPFLFLTSLSQDVIKKEGYEYGADAYVTKPFDVDYLQLRIRSLIRSREEFRERLKHEFIANPKEVHLDSADDKFLAKAMQVIEENIDNEDFSVDIFAQKMNLSTSMLYRKMKRLTDRSPSEFCRDIRLKRAAQLLETRAYTISEIAGKVGFSDIRYFSTCFKREYGMTPSAYQASHD